MSTGPEPGPTALDRALRHSQVCVLSGGRSPERDISIASGERIARALGAPDGPGDQRGPAEVIEVEVAANGAWIVAGEELPPAAALLALAGVDLFFLALHGGDGEDGTMQGFLRVAGCAHTGTGVGGSAVAMDKIYAREILGRSGVSVAPGFGFEARDWRDAPGAILDRAHGLGSDGWAVKPRRGGSSLGTALVRAAGELSAAIEAALGVEPSVLVEGLVTGVEVTGSVLEQEEGPVALPVVEIQPHPGTFFDYEEKYSSGGAREVCPPESLSRVESERVRELALLAHRQLGAAGVSRSDFLVPRTGVEPAEPVFLELNTLPGMTPRSLLPIAASVAGIDYRTLCLRIAERGLASPREGGS